MTGVQTCALPIFTDYGSNYEFVRHVLMMDSTFRGNHGMWRAVNSPLVHTAFYIGIIAWESVTMLLCWWAGVLFLARRHPNMFIRVSFLASSWKGNTDFR